MDHWLKLSFSFVGDSWVIPIASLFSLDKTSLRSRYDEAWQTKSSFLKYCIHSLSFLAAQLFFFFFFYIDSSSPYKCSILQHFRYHKVCVNKPEKSLPRVKGFHFTNQCLFWKISKIVCTASNNFFHKYLTTLKAII